MWKDTKQEMFLILLNNEKELSCGRNKYDDLRWGAAWIKSSGRRGAAHHPLLSRGLPQHRRRGWLPSVPFFKKAKNEKDQQLHGEEAVKDHLWVN